MEILGGIILLFIGVAVSILFIRAYDVQFSELQTNLLIWTVVAIAVGGGAFFLFKYLNFTPFEQKSDMQEAWKFAKKWWGEVFRETLVEDDMEGSFRHFNKPHFAFYAHRDTSSVKAGQPIQIIVKKGSKFDVVHYDAAPPAQAEEDPFFGWTSLEGLPDEGYDVARDPIRKPSTAPAPIIKQEFHEKKDEEMIKGKKKED